MNVFLSKFSGLVGFACIVAGWYALAESHVFLTTLVPQPHQVFQSLIFLFSKGAIFGDAGLTLYRTGVSFAFSSLVGIPLGLVLGYSQTAYRIFLPVVDFFRSVPATALFPLFILFFGISDMSVFAATVFGDVFLIMVNAMYGVHNANKSRILLARTMNASQLQIFRKVVFYEALPYIFVGLRQALSLSIIIVIVTEMFFGSGTGLGYRIYNFNILYDSPDMYAVIILVGIIGYVLNQVFIRFEKKIIHWVGR